MERRFHYKRVTKIKIYKCLSQLKLKRDKKNISIFKKCSMD